VGPWLRLSTSIEIEWTLEELLEYLTLAPFGYEIDAALREMERAISTGELPLIDEEYVDDKLKSRYRLKPFYFRSNYILEFDRRNHRVRVAPRQREVKWGNSVFHFYLVIKQDAQRVWPRRQPAPNAAPLKPKVWLPLEHERRKQLNNIPKDITTYTEQLHEAAVKAVRQERLTNAPTARRFENLLHELSLFPKTKRRTKHARNTHD
jgi:hypothetical protein